MDQGLGGFADGIGDPVSQAFDHCDRGCGDKPSGRSGLDEIVHGEGGEWVDEESGQSEADGCDRAYAALVLAKGITGLGP